MLPLPPTCSRPVFPPGPAQWVNPQENNQHSWRFITMDHHVYFDEDCSIRILDTDKLQTSKSLQDNSSKFVSNMQQLQDSVVKYVAAIDQQVERLEVENLRAMGLRNKMAAMHEERRQKKQELQQVVKEKQQELDRLLVEEQSLMRMRAEQESLLAKLTDTSSYGGS